MKTISDQEVKAHILRTNPWWRGDCAAIAPIRHARPRPYLEVLYPLVAQLSVRRAVVLLGPRRVGKTYLIFHLVERLLQEGVDPRRIGYLDVEHPVLQYQSLTALVDALDNGTPSSPEQPRFVFLDEIQYLRDWERHLKPIVDERPDLRILVSGSAAAALKRSSQESGAGRFTDFLLPPLTFPEYLLLSGQDELLTVNDNRYHVPDYGQLNQAFINYLNYGGYPEVALSEEVRADAQRFIKSDIVDKVLLRDLPILYGISDVQELNALFTMLAYNTAQVISPSELSQKSNVAKPTLLKYIEYLEAAFLIHRLQRIDQSGRRLKRQHQFKAYLTNPTMRAALFGEMTADHDSFGALVETGLLAQLFHADHEIRYAAWNGGEVDLVHLHRNLQPQAALEAKWSNRPLQDARLTRNLTKFCRSTGLNAAICTTIDQWGERQQDGILIRLIPAAIMCYHLGAITLDSAGIPVVAENRDKT